MTPPNFEYLPILRLLVKVVGEIAFDASNEDQSFCKLVARVDLKSDRATSRLLAHAVHLEPGNDAAKVAGPLREELRLMADWLGLESVVLPRTGVLARAMNAPVRRR